MEFTLWFVMPTIIFTVIIIIIIIKEVGSARPKRVIWLSSKLIWHQAHLWGSCTYSNYISWISQRICIQSYGFARSFFDDTSVLLRFCSLYPRLLFSYLGFTCWLSLSASWAPAAFCDQALSCMIRFFTLDQWLLAGLAVYAVQCLL